jgi:CheY-specific phosphatase CheX
MCVVVVERVLPDLNEVLCTMLFQMFGQCFQNDNTDYREVSLPPCKDYIISIQVNGNNLEGDILFTVDSQTAEDLISSVGIHFDNHDKQRDLMHSALGELANVVAGQLMEYKSFKNIFGSVTIHPPIVWDSESPEGCIPVRNGISGSVQHGQCTIPTFISCTESNTIEIKVKDYTDKEKAATQTITLSS